MTQRLEESEALWTKAMNELSDEKKIIQESEKEKIIQEQANLIKEKEKAAEMFDEQERSHAEMAKRLEESEATSTRADKKMSERLKIIQEQGNLIKEIEKESNTDEPSAKDKEIMAAQEKIKKKERAQT